MAVTHWFEVTVANRRLPQQLQASEQGDGILPHLGLDEAWALSILLMQVHSGENKDDRRYSATYCPAGNSVGKVIPQNVVVRYTLWAT